MFSVFSQCSKRNFYKKVAFWVYQTQKLVELFSKRAFWAQKAETNGHNHYFMIHKFFCHLPSIISTNCDKSYISITIFICFNINILWNMYHFSKVILETILKWVGKLSLNIPYIELFYAKIYLTSKFNKESQNSFYFDFFFF